MSTVRIAPVAAAPAHDLESDGFRNLWVLAAGGLVLGYLLMTRSFAYLGLERYSLFVGEVFLIGFYLVKSRESLGAFAWSLVDRTDLSFVAWSIYTLAAYGLVTAVRGIFQGYETVAVLHTLVFVVYPFYFFVGLWIGRVAPRFLDRFVPILAWFGGIYGLAYVLVLNRLPYTFPGTDVIPLFGQPAAPAVAIVAILCMYRKLTTWMLVALGLNGLVVLALQVRAQWVGLAISLLVWSILTHRLGRFLLAVMVFTMLLVVAYVTDLTIPSPTPKQDEFSARTVIGAVVAPIDEDLAATYTESAGQFAGSARWRQVWWEGIWADVNADLRTQLIGHGYGFPLKTLAPFTTGEEDLRTPHNFFFFVLAYSGWVGVVLTGVLFLSMLGMLWVAFKRTQLAFGLAFFVLQAGIAAFSNHFETPFGAIPFYTILGVSAAPALRALRAPAQPVAQG